MVRGVAPNTRHQKGPAMNLDTVYDSARTASYNVARPVLSCGWAQAPDGQATLEVYMAQEVTVTFMESSGVVTWEANQGKDLLAQGATASRRELDKILRRDFRPLT